MRELQLVGLQVFKNKVLVPLVVFEEQFRDALFNTDTYLNLCIHSKVTLLTSESHRTHMFYIN